MKIGAVYPEIALLEGSLKINKKRKKITQAKHIAREAGNPRRLKNLKLH